MVKIILIFSNTKSNDIRCTDDGKTEYQSLIR